MLHKKIEYKKYEQNLLKILNYYGKSSFVTLCIILSFSAYLDQIEEMYDTIKLGVDRNL